MKIKAVWARLIAFFSSDIRKMEQEFANIRRDLEHGTIHLRTSEHKSLASEVSKISARVTALERPQAIEKTEKDVL